MAKWEAINSMEKNIQAAWLSPKHALYVDRRRSYVEWFSVEDGNKCQRMGRYSFECSDDWETIHTEAIKAVYSFLKKIQKRVPLSDVEEDMLAVLEQELGTSDKEDKAMICKMLLPVYQQTRQFSDLVDLVYEKDEKKDVETVTAVFANGAKRRINVTMDSGWRMIQDIANHIDG